MDTVQILSNAEGFWCLCTGAIMLGIDCYEGGGEYYDD